uniref:CST complex subunit CTC1 n=1 Tax=Saccoglossus kowalevskii TaxID=10224 RepID=A0ABM0MAH3_SACKO
MKYYDGAQLMFITVDFSWLDQWVIIPTWNFILPKGFEGSCYLEISDRCLPMEMLQESHSNMKGLQGSNNAYSVFAATNKTKFYKIRKEDCKEITIKRLETRYLCKGNIDVPNTDTPCDDKITECHSDPPPCSHGDSESPGPSYSHTSSVSGSVQRESLCSYKGTITEVVNSEAGVYDLDSKVRLYIGYQPCPNQGRGMRVGVKVEILNAHLKVYKMFITVDFSWLDQWVIIPTWNFILPKGFEGSCYLEISDRCLPMEMLQESHSNMKGLQVISTTLALRILDNRNNYNLTRSVTLHGEITALSPVHRKPDSVVFFVELTSQETEDRVSLVLKGIQFSHWYHFLRLKEEFAFTNAVPTTVSKGSNNAYSVFAATNKTKFYKIRKEDCKEITIKRLETRYLCKGNIDVPNTDTPCDDKITECHSDPPPCSHGDSESPGPSYSHTSSVSGSVQRESLCSYKGTITEVVNSEAGVYDLDSKVRLYIGYQPCPNQGRGMRVGVKVEILNAHLKVYKMIPRIRLCCCTPSTVLITEFSPLLTAYRPFLTNTSVYMHLLYSNNLSLVYYQWLVDMAIQMKKKFVPQILSEKLLMGMHIPKHNKPEQNIPGVFFNILRIASPSDQKPLLPKLSRNIYAEFLDPRHPCSVVGSDAVSKSDLYTIPTMAELKQMLEKMAFREESWRPVDLLVSQQTTNLNEALYWRYDLMEPADFKPPLLLIGHLEVCNKTGLLQLVDQTGSIDCVIADLDDSDHSHTCDPTCLYQNTQSQNQTRRFNCPYVKSWCLGQLLRLNRYQVVVERFLISSFPSVEQLGCSKYIEKSQIRSYVQFSMSDAVNFHKKLNRDNAGCNDTVSLKRKREYNKSTISTSVERPETNHTGMKPTTDVVQLFVVNDKQFLHVKPVTVNGEKSIQLSSNVAVTLLGMPDIVSRKQGIESITKVDTDRDAASNPSGNARESRHHGEHSVHKTSLEHKDSLPERQAVLVLQGETIKWYHLLHNGQPYALIMPRSQ